MSATNGHGQTDGSALLERPRPVLELSGISAGYGRTKVLRDVDLTVRAGSVVALLGPNGAGKTTLLRVAAGLLTPTEGRVAIGTDEVTRRRPSQRAREGLCLIPEGRGIFPNLSVRENLLLQVPAWKRGQSVEPALAQDGEGLERRLEAVLTLPGWNLQEQVLPHRKVGENPASFGNQAQAFAGAL